MEGGAEPRRGSGSTASRKARATDLKAASARWWLFSPWIWSMCSVMPPWVASARKNSRTSSVSKVPIFAVGKARVKIKEGACGEVERAGHLRVIHGKPEMAVATDTALVAERFCKRLAEGGCRHPHRVVVVDVQIALGADFQVDRRMAGELVEHVVEEAHPGLAARGAGAVEVDGDRDGGLVGVRVISA